MLNINGVRVGEDEPVSDGDEIALLPPVSGG
ncbi:MAG: MoaD/ThiS family protein [Candidatus Poseidoniaceae archaeon]